MFREITPYFNLPNLIGVCVKCMIVINKFVERAGKPGGQQIEAIGCAVDEPVLQFVGDLGWPSTPEESLGGKK